ncbi:MAG: hypothetical protein KC656_18105, partial [Myxococcales bacterium]|nr:hypothetical protein [Myxococcales bacterium]
MLAALWLWVGLALAQGVLPSTVDRPPVPSAGLATEDGPGALWVNPANMAYDPDARWALFYRYDPDGTHPHGLAGTYGIGGLGVGLRWHHSLVGASDFVFDLALGVKLPKRVAVGLALRWNILQESPNFVAFD